MGGKFNPRGEVQIWTTSDALLPQGRHAAFDVLAKLRFGGDAALAADHLREQGLLPEPVLQATRRPNIDIGESADSMQAVGQLVEAVADAEAAHNPGQPLFLRQVDADGQTLGMVSPRAGLPPLPVSDKAMRGAFIRCAQPVSGYRESKTEGEAATPINAHSVPEALAQNAYDELLHGRRLAPVSVISPTPALLADGSIVSKPGYDREKQAYVSIPRHQQAHWKAYSVPTQPSQKEVQAAADLLLNGMLGDFPFVDNGDRATALAYVLTACAPHLSSKRPGFAIMAPDRGTGKSLIGEAVRLLAAGNVRMTDISPFTKQDAESEKKLVGGVLSGGRFAGVDNVPTGAKVTSTLMTTLLTASDGGHPLRRLGVNEDVYMSGWVWTIAGNSISLHGDLQRRFLAIDLEVRHGLAFERTGFRHADLLGWVRENRPHLLAAAHTILRAGILAAKPISELSFRLGTYEEWSTVVVGALENVVIRDSELGIEESAAALLDSGRQEFIDDNDPDSDAWGEVLEILAVRAGGKALEASKFVEMIFGDARLGDVQQPVAVLPGAPVRIQDLALPQKIEDVKFKSTPPQKSKALGEALASIRSRKIPYDGRIYKVYNPPRSENSKKALRWVIEVQDRATGEIVKPWEVTDHAFAAAA